MQLSLLSQALDSVLDQQRLAGLWLGGERWFTVGGQQVSAFVFFHLRASGEALISLRSDDVRLPSRVHGRWWLEGAELVVTLGTGEIRGRYGLDGDVLTWADEILVRKAVPTARGVQEALPVDLPPEHANRPSVRLQFELD